MAVGAMASSRDLGVRAFIRSSSASPRGSSSPLQLGGMAVVLAASCWLARARARRARRLRPECAALLAALASASPSCSSTRPATAAPRGRGSRAGTATSRDGGLFALRSAASAASAALATAGLRLAANAMIAVRAAKGSRLVRALALYRSYVLLALRARRGVAAAQRAGVVLALVGVGLIAAATKSD